MIKSMSSFVSRERKGGWGVDLANAIDAAIEKLSKDREVVSVAVTPVVTSTQSVVFHGEAFDTSTAGVIVTVVWRDVS